MLFFDHEIAGGPAHDVEHFEDRNAAADELRKGARKTGHANLMNERTENRELELPAIPELLAARRTQKGAHAENDVPPMPRTRKYHFARTKSLTSIRNCVGAGSLAPKSAKISPKTGTTLHDQESGNGEGNANHNDRDKSSPI